MKRHFIYLLCALLAFSACSRSIIGEKMILPAQVTTQQSDNYKIVVYYNERGCTPCRLGDLGGWNLLLKEAESQSLPIDFVFILKAEETNPEINQKISDARFTHPIIFDSIGEFESKNTLPEDDMDHVFLLDHKETVVSIGNPLYYPKVWDKFSGLFTVF